MLNREIKIIAFDLDNTLYSQDKYYIQVIKKFASFAALNPTEMEQVFFRVKDVSRDIFGDMLREVGRYSIELQEVFFNFYKTIDAKVELFPSAKEVVTLLVEQKIDRAIITNGVLEVQRNKIRCLGIESLFDLIIYARMWGKEFEKPHAKSFQYLLDYFDCSPENVLFLGDKHEIDILGATKVGMSCELVEDNCDFLKIISKYIKI